MFDPIDPKELQQALYASAVAVSKNVRLLLHLIEQETKLIQRDIRI